MASSATTTRTTHSLDRTGERELEVISISWVAHTDGTFTDYTIPGGKVKGVLERLVVDPGATAPTNLYDVTIVDEDGVDVLGGGGANLLTATTEEKAVPLGTYHLRTLANVLKLQIANNSQNGALGLIRLYVRR
jgi:hypothetical protein